MKRRRKDESNTSESESVESPMKKQKQNPKRDEATIRNEMLDRGALLLKFSVTKKPSQKVKDDWRIIERKGFLVTTLGCLIPASTYFFKARAKKVGYDCAYSFFIGEEPRRQEMKKSTNQFGWDTADSMSHRCHRNQCASFLHIVREPRWKNWKRNYCGYDGRCDCGVEPSCVSRYYPDHFQRDEPSYLTYETKGLKKKLDEMFGTENISVKLLPRDIYVNEDTKRAARMKRIKGSSNTLKETKKKLKRKEAKTEAK